MYKHATRLTLALITLLHLSTAAASRHPRSIWPWSAPEPQEEPLISEKHAEILRQAGHGELLDLSSHPLWKVHKYEGIELKPVQVQTEVIKSPAGAEAPPQLPSQLDERKPVSSVAPLTESQSESDAEAASASSDESDSDGLFGDFSLLSYLFPSFGFGFGFGSDSEDEQETEKAGALADAIRDEEQSHPGFFAKLWSKIWGSDDESSSQSKAVEQTADGSYGEYAPLPETIALPPTRQRYAEISLIQPTARQTHYVIREQPANQASQYAYGAGAVAQQQQQQQQQAAAVVQPVGKWYPNQQLHHSQAYIQSWNPNAAYNVQVAGPSEYPSEHVATVQAYTANHFQRKVSDSQTEAQEELAGVNDRSPKEVVVAEQAIPTTTTTTTTTSQSSVRVPKNQRDETAEETKSQVQEVAHDLASEAKNKSEWETVRESIVQALGSKYMPKKIANRLKNIERLINDKKAGQESINELKRLQDEFEAKKKQLGAFYPEVRRAFPPIPTAPMS